jgi:TolB-like protein/DNA-binding winged helix-turn-helix (wHTH) protein
MSDPSALQVFAFAGFSLDTRQRLLFGPDGRAVPLSARAFDTLLYLVEHPNQLVDKQALMKAVWPNQVVEENNLNQNISIVRRALGETPGEHRFVVTIPGRGFRFVPPVLRRAMDVPSTPAPQPAPPSPSTAPEGPPDASASDASPAPARRPPVDPRPTLLWGRLAALAAVVLAGYLFVHHFWKGGAAASFSTTATSTPPHSAAAPSEPSIAVLPFVNMSADKDQEYFADGLTEELSTEVAQLRGVRVVGRSSAFLFKGKNEDLRKIGTALGVDHILEGTVRKSGDTLRITAELIDSTNGSQLWSKVYERKFADVFAIQEEIAKAVTTTLSTTLHAPADERSMLGTRNPEAYDAYLAATAHLKNLGSSETLRGIEGLKQAVRLDPNYAQAWASLADAYMAVSHGMEVDTLDYERKSHAALSRALELAPQSSQLAAQAAMTATMSTRDWRALEEMFRRLADPSNEYGASISSGQLAETLGRPHEAVGYFIRARHAEPLLLAPSLELQETYHALEDWQAASTEYERSKGLNGDALRNDGEGLLGVGLDRHDTVLIRRFFEAQRLPDKDVLLAGLDNPAVAIAYLRTRISAPATQGVTAVEQAMWAAYYGDPELALQGMRKGLASIPFDSFFLWRPVLKEMRRRPGFKDLVRELRLVDYWRATGNWGEFCHPVGQNDFECR